MTTSLQSLVRLTLVVLSWIPFLVFFSIITFMFLTDFKNPVDEYFVTLVLRACLMLIISAAIAQAVSLTMILAAVFVPGRSQVALVKEGLDFFNAFPVVDIGIFSIAIFFTSQEFRDWILILVLLLLIPTVCFWTQFLRGPVRNLFAFARFHQVQRRTINAVLSPFYFKTFVDYFFVTLKRYLMPLVFILVVMDFRLILPRLMEAGLSYQAFALFLSLVISLNLLSSKPEAV